MFNKSDKPSVTSEDFKKDVTSIFGSELESIILYGSGAREEYVPGSSDLNFLVVISPQGMKYIEGIWEYESKWAKRNIATPLVLTKSYIETSLDTFPLEFSDMSDAHIVIFGTDVLEDIKVDSADLRLEIERELKTNLLKIRQGFIRSAGREDELKILLHDSFSTVTALFRGIAKLLDFKMKDSSQDEIFKMIESEFSLKKDLFSNLKEIRLGAQKINSAELKSYLHEYMEAIRTVFNKVDEMED